MIHPLLNPDSASYYDNGAKPAIQILEEQTSVGKQMRVIDAYKKYGIKVEYTL